MAVDVDDEVAVLVQGALRRSEGLTGDYPWVSTRLPAPLDLS